MAQGTLPFAASRRPRVQARLWFDGAAEPNPGWAGGGARLLWPGGERRIVEPIGRGTNNQAEYAGLIAGLREALAQGVTDIEVLGDSELIIRQMQGSYRVKSSLLKPLHLEASSLLSRFEKARLRWIPREENAVADRLSMEAAGLARQRGR